MSAVWLGAGLLLILLVVVALYAQQGRGSNATQSVATKLHEERPETDTLADVSRALEDEPGNRSQAATSVARALDEQAERVAGGRAVLVGGGARLPDARGGDR